MLFFLNIDVAVATQNIMINILTLDWIMFTIVFGAAEKNTRVKSLVVDWIVFRLSVFFLGKVREPGDRPEESRRHVHSRGSITWTSKLSAGPDTVGECRFWTGVGDGETSGIAAGYRRRQSRYGLRLAGLVDSLLADKRLLFAGW